MLVTRWQAAMMPNKQQLRTFMQLEGMIPDEEVYPPQTQVHEHRHPFDEVRIVVEGELHMNISGNKLLLRTGDRIYIPSNTRHSMKNEGASECVCLCAQRV